MERVENCRFYDPASNYCFWRTDLLALQRIASGQIVLTLPDELGKVPTGAFSRQEYQNHTLWCSAYLHNEQQTCSRYVGKEDQTPVEALIVELEL